MNRPTAQIGLALVLAALVSAGGCKPKGATGASNAAGAPQSVAVTLAPVTKSAVDRTVDVTGTLFADEDTVVSAKLSGRVAAISHDVGDMISPGAPLVQLDKTDYELEVSKARTAAAASLAKLGLTDMPGDSFDPSKVPTVAKAAAEAANAQAKFERARHLFEQAPPLIAEQDFADIQTARDVAKNQSDVEVLLAQANVAEARALAAATAIAEQRLADTVLGAPRIEGHANLRYRVAERMVSVGEFVEAGRSLMRLVATDVVKFRAKAPERYAGAVRPGALVRITTEAASRPREGRVSRISPTVDPQNRTFMIEILVDNADGLLQPGAFARGSIVTGRDEGATFVPAAAVTTFAGINRVYSVAEGKAVEHRVELGARQGELVEVVTPLVVQQVVSPIPPGLAPGVAVK